MSGLVVDISAPPSAPPDELTLTVGDIIISGWEQVEVTLLAEGFPNSFQIALSSKEPITSEAVVAKAGDTCEVRLGNDLVITGYVDKDVPGGDAGNHSIMLIGRSKTADLVDCSGEWGSGAMTNVNVLDVATKLAGAYGISVKLANGADVGPTVDQLIVNYGETGAEQIQRFARNAGLMAYEDGTGTLLLSGVGATTAASGVVYGQNVESWFVENSVDGQYSDITCLQQSQDTMIELGDGGEFVFNAPNPSTPKLRHRLLYIIQEQAAFKPEEFTKAKANWQMSRQIGRSVKVSVRVDSWRDSAGALWMPNTLVAVDVPGLRLADKTLCISQVTFRRNDQTGTTADLLMMPPAAFAPEPIALVQVNVLGIDQVDPAP